ncbi:MAG: TCR/Tet family MFS transporter [Halocynthiibacter sp.]
MKTRLPVIFITFTIMIDAMGIGLIMPVMPDLIREIQGTDIANAAKWGGILATAWAVMQFIFSPLIGNLSDRFGRKPVMILSLGVMAFDYLIMVFAHTIWLLLIGRLIGGITAATHSTANAFMADISKKGEKAQNFGLVSAAFGIGFILGPVLGGLLSVYGPRAPFIAAAILAGGNAVFGLIVMPETVTPEKRRIFEWKRANPFGAFKSIGKLPGLMPLIIVFFLYNVATFVYPSVWSYFGQQRFGWSPQIVGLSLAIVGISMAVVQGWLIRVILPRFGSEKTVHMGFLITIFAFLSIAFIPIGWLVLILTPISALGGLAAPALNAIMSEEVDDRQQGELQGALSSVAALGTIMAPYTMTQVFGYFSAANAPLYFPGAPFILSAILMGIAIVIFTRHHRSNHRPAP